MNHIRVFINAGVPDVARLFAEEVSFRTPL